jgi:hypothetical protein
VRSAKVGGISKARPKPLKRRSGTLGFSSQVAAASRHREREWPPSQYLNRLKEMAIL